MGSGEAISVEAGSEFRSTLAPRWDGKGVGPVIWHYTQDPKAHCLTDLQTPDYHWDRLADAVEKSVSETAPMAEGRYVVWRGRLSSLLGLQSQGAGATPGAEQLVEWSDSLRLRSALVGDESPQRVSSRNGTKSEVLDVIHRLRESVRRSVSSDGWEGASPEALERALGDAEEFVSGWVGTPVAKPDVGLADDGEVNFFWKHEGARVDLGFFGDGTYSYFAKDRHGERYFGDDVPAGDGLADELLIILVDQA